MKRLLSILLCALLLALPLGLYASSAETVQRLWPTTQFVTGEKPWWIMPRLLRLQYIPKSATQGGFRQDSLLILHEGRLVHEEYGSGYDMDTPHAAWSVTKSVVSALVGIAVGEGLIEGPEQKVRDFYPEAVIAPGQESKLDMTVAHLLQMRSGLPDSSECFRADDAGLAAFETPQERDPGGRFAYNSGAGPQCVVGILQRATGQNLFDYAQEKLFGPLGMDSVAWERTEDGSPRGGYGIYMTPRDMLRFGYLYLNDGVWDEQRILPEGWVAQTRDMQRAWVIFSYGFFFWDDGNSLLLGPSYEARGLIGQFVTIYPEKGVVVVRTSGGFRG